MVDRRIIVLVILGMFLVACASLKTQETVGQQFRKVLADIDALCKKEKLGPYLDPSDPQYKDKRKQQGTCDILTLKPSDPLATPEGRFAHSLKLPPPHDQPKNIWREGMTGEEYFKALCEAEAGEWVFRTVENVEGVFQLRSYIPSENLLGALFAYEGITGERVAGRENSQDALVQPPVGGYNYLEVTASLEERKKYQSNYLRYFRDSNSKTNKLFYYTRKGTYQNFQTPYIVSVEKINSPRSRHAYIQRGIMRFNALEHGIKGAELLIVDRETNEVIAFRRVFGRFYFDPAYRDRHQLFTDACGPESSGFRFIQQVLHPTNRIEQ